MWGGLRQVWPIRQTQTNCAMSIIYSMLGKQQVGKISQHLASYWSDTTDTNSDTTTIKTSKQMMSAVWFCPKKRTKQQNTKCITWLFQDVICFRSFSDSNVIKPEQVQFKMNMMKLNMEEKWSRKQQILLDMMTTHEKLWRQQRTREEKKVICWARWPTLFCEMLSFSTSTSRAPLLAAKLTFHLQNSCPTSVPLQSEFL